MDLIIDCIIWIITEIVYHFVFWNSDAKDERRSCVVAIALLIAILLMGGVLLWVVFSG